MSFFYRMNVFTVLTELNFLKGDTNIYFYFLNVFFFEKRNIFAEKDEVFVKIIQIFFLKI